MDSVDNNKNGKIDMQDSTEWTRITTFYSVEDLNELSEQFISQDTVNVNLSRKNLIAGTVTVKNQQGSVVAPANYVLNTGTRGHPGERLRYLAGRASTRSLIGTIPSIKVRTFRDHRTGRELRVGYLRRRHAGFRQRLECQGH